MRPRSLFLLLAAVSLPLGTGMVVAQIDGGSRGVAAIDSSSDYEVGGVSVDVAGKDADAARYGGWRIAQRKAWAQLARRLGGSGGTLPDGTLDGIVTGIVVENEQIGPKRYVAKLGVLFDRARAGALLGVSGYIERSPPMVLIPVQWSAGVGEAFEQRTPWHEAWARFRTGGSTIDYIRPTGAGADPLLLNVGQVTRPGRGWWRATLDQYGGSDVLMPTVRLNRQWPGGPVVATFQARYGPDNRMLEQFVLRVGTSAGLPALLDAGVKRLDEAYQRALGSGYLRADPGLSYVPEPPKTEDENAVPDEAIDAGLLPAATTVIAVQFDTPGAAAVNAGESAMRAVPGVSSASTSSLALGGLSVMAVSYAGPPEAFRAALEARGWQVLGSGASLRIRRAPQLLPSDIAPAPAPAPAPANAPPR